MQVTAIYAGAYEYSEKLNYIFNIFNNTSSELGIKIETIDITKLNIEFFSGKKVTIVENIFNNIKNSSAVIFVCTAKLFSLCGAMHVFLEHFEENALYGKPCYTIVTSFDGSEFNAGNYMNTVINFLGGNSIGSMLVGSQYLDGIEFSIETTRMIERYAEDFYRVLKQNRKLFQAKPFNFTSSKNDKVDEKFNFDESKAEKSLEFGANSNFNQKVVKNLSGQQVSELYQREIDSQNFKPYYNNDKNVTDFNQKFSNFSGVSSGLVDNFMPSSSGIGSSFPNSNDLSGNYETQLQNFNDYQDNDISEITKLLTQQYNNKKGSLENFSVDTVTNEKMLNGGTCKQRTQSLYHYFQPQIAQSMNIIIQINISGEENFSGYLQIKNGECAYFDGGTQSFDVAIISDSDIWEDVLNGKYTLQKAFMLGKVKVKGNFVIISKFEQLFKLN